MQKQAVVAAAYFPSKVKAPVLSQHANEWMWGFKRNKISRGKLRKVSQVKLIGGVTSVPGKARGEKLVYCRVLEPTMKEDELLGTTRPGTGALPSSRLTRRFRSDRRRLLSCGVSIFMLRILL